MKKLVFFGDFCVTNPHKLEFDSELMAYLNEIDLKICNFEAPIVFQNCTPILKSGPAICQSIESADFLKKMGFGVFLLANNHIMDYGEVGLNDTLEVFKEYVTVGAGENPYEVKCIHLGNFKIGILAVTQREFGTVRFNEKKPGTAWIGDEQVVRVIKKAKQKMDFLFVCPHAGLEDIFVPLPEWRERYKYFVDCGADAIIASHPHTPQGWEMYNEKYIFYSIGNFCFDLESANQDEYFNTGLCIEVSISDKGLEFVPRVLKYENGVLAFDNSKKVLEHISDVNCMLKENESYNAYLDRISDELFPMYKYGMLRDLQGVSSSLGIIKAIKLIIFNVTRRGNGTFLLNSMQCESHRWIIERYLRRKI